MISRLIEQLVGIIVHVIGTTGYSGIFVLMLLESCGIPAPSEVIMPFAGFLVGIGRLQFWPAVLLGALGNLAGSLLAYGIGRLGGRPLLARWGKYIFISQPDLDRADGWFKRHGEATVLVGRLLPVIRTYISFPAGISEMNIGTFSFYTLLGALPWSMLFTWLGVKLQNNWVLIHTKLHNFDTAMAVVLVTAIIWYVYRHVRHSRLQPTNLQ